MSRTSNALMRFGVAGLAVVTIGAGAPVFVGAASAQQATTTASLNITPSTQSGAAGTCIVYTVTPRDAAGNVSTDTPTVTVEVTENPSSDAGFVSFCDPTEPPAAGSNGQNANAGDNTLDPTAPGFISGANPNQGATTASGTFPGGNARTTAAFTFGIRSSAPGGANIRAFISRTGSQSFVAGDIQTSATATFTAGGRNANDVTSGGNAAQDAVRTITDVTPAGLNNLAGSPATFTVQVRNAANDTVSGVTVSARVLSGPNGQQVSAAGTVTENAAAITCPVTNNAGVTTCQYNTNADRTGTDQIQVWVNQTSGQSAGPEAGEPQLTINRTINPAPTTNTSLARFVSLAPESVTTVAGQSQTFVATVTTATGRPVQGQLVTFIEEGPGRFNTGSSTVTATTDERGQARATTNSLVGESGTEVITASIPNIGNETGQAAGAGAGATSTTPAGNNADSSTQTFVATAPSPSASATTPASPSPSATPTAASPSPSATQAGRLTISVSPATITPGVQSVVTVTGSPGTIIELQAYSRPNTTYSVVRRGTIGESGTIEFRVVPGTNTRLFAAVTGQTGNESPSVVINVRTALSLTVVRNGSRDYTFQGRILPRRAGQLITLYRVANGREIITSQIKTDNTGTYFIRRVFTGSGVFGFLTRTGQTLTNAAGVSNNGQARPTAIYAGPQR